jgi:hypothetical protein
MLPFLRVTALLLSLAIALAPLAAQEYHTTEQWRAKYDHETDPVRKARLLPPLGDSEFKDAEAALAADKNSQALDIVKAYLDEAQTVQKALDAKIVDPEKHANGYKQLQISIRGALRRLDSMIVGMAGDDKPPFVEIRSQLDDIDRHLIQQLFPKQPTNTEPTKPKK